MSKPRKKPRRKKYAIAQVRWLDAVYQREVMPGEVEVLPGVELITTGMVVREDEKAISLALDFDAYDHSYRHVQNIPKSYVREIRRLTI